MKFKFFTNTETVGPAISTSSSGWSISSKSALSSSLSVLASAMLSEPASLVNKFLGPFSKYKIDFPKRLNESFVNALRADGASLNSTMAIVPAGGINSLLSWPYAENSSPMDSNVVPCWKFFTKITLSSLSLVSKLVKSTPFSSKYLRTSPITWASARACFTAELLLVGSISSPLLIPNFADTLSKTASLFMYNEFQLNCCLEDSYLFLSSFCFFKGRLARSNSVNVWSFLAFPGRMCNSLPWKICLSSSK
ncbi:hypothetical protein OGAPHI_001666 [Ogataea philodendri]|uniref:Uncharacterized protein n=1 Tax=Ogataea philodendri TaxID=1378263 RepID=A0A9P8PCH5_9ASCO|nr:uncharacterized protein OGAPHI_001666 [Ogataea philodendri]KAH3669070.1 hypothetical protein OGAPHI_001666 [Ogataea philodendri]